MSKEKRWIILADDGRHVTIGRHTDPSEDKIQTAGKALVAAGTGGWLAVTEGRYYSCIDDLGILMVREIAPPRATWEEAIASFRRMRKVATRPAGKTDGPAGPT